MTNREPPKMPDGYSIALHTQDYTLTLMRVYDPSMPPSAVAKVDLNGNGSVNLYRQGHIPLDALELLVLCARGERPDGLEVRKVWSHG